MRFLVKVSIPIETNNERIKNNEMGLLVQSILEDIEAEAAYFITEGGQPTGLIFVNMEAAAEVIKVTEPWMLAFDAKVEITPAMTPEDLLEALPYFEHSARKYG